MLYTYKAKCINVVDGDTFDFEVDLGFHLQKKIRVRLMEVDTPELRSAIEQERKHAREAKAFVETLLLDKQMTIHTEKSTGIYGRFSAQVILPDGESLADKLTEAKMLKKAAEEYCPSMAAKDD